MRNQRVFVSLTDMAKIKVYKPGIVIANWLNTKKTLAFLEAWEGEHNPLAFKVIESHYFKTHIGTPAGRISLGIWLRNTGAIGLETIPGRYGGTFAALEIPHEFAAWLSPGFKIKFNAALRDQLELNQELVFARRQIEALAKPPQ